MFQLLSVIALAAVSVTRVQAGPMPPVFSDEKAEVDSRDSNEVGPEENWQLFNRMTKTKTFDPSDSDKTRELLKEIEEFSRLVANVTEGNSDTATDVTEVDSASSDLFASTWRNLIQNDDGGRVPGFERQDVDDSNVEDIIRKISTDLKKLYVKIKQVITAVKTWYALWNVANTVLIAAG